MSAHVFRSKRPLIIGITGGIASGKSSVARMFSGRGILHVDADRIVHALMRDDRDVMIQLIQAFPKLVTPSHDGVPLNQGNEAGPRRKDGVTAYVERTTLAAHIATNPAALATLEAILHPRVRQAEEDTIMAATRNRCRAVILDIPLLFETGADELCDVTIAVHAPLAHRRRRAFARPGMTQAKWARLIARQWPAADRNHLADIVIHTSIGKAATRKRVTQLMRAWGLV